MERLGLLHLVDLHIDLASRRIDMAQPLLRPVSMAYIRAHVMAYLLAAGRITRPPPSSILAVRSSPSSRRAVPAGRTSSSTTAIGCRSTSATGECASTP